MGRRKRSRNKFQRRIRSEEWEYDYKIIKENIIYKDLEAILNEKREKGWELVIVFKRFKLGEKVDR